MAYVFATRLLCLTFSAVALLIFSLERKALMERLWQDVVFDDYRISSQNQDRIAFTVDLTLLLRALKSSVSIYGDRLQVKLVRKRPSLSERPMPYLTFESKVRGI